MIIESVQLAHVGPFRGNVSVGPFARGLNVLAAYNEEGKSTLVRALTRALFDRHTSKSEEIRHLQPLGTNLAPTVGVDFEVGGVRYHIYKQFLESPQSHLYKFNGRDWELLAEGDGADKKLYELLGARPAGRGATKPEHWGLFQYLWARQGEPAVWPEWRGEAGELVRAKLVKIELDPLIERLQQAFDAEYAQVFTETGRVRTHGPLDTAERELDNLRDKLSEIQRKLKELEDAETRFRTVSERIQTLEAEVAQKKRETQEIADKAHKAEVTLKELESKQKDLETARQRLAGIDRDQQELAKLEKDVSELDTQIEQSRNIRDSLTQEIAEAEKQQMEADKKLAREQEAKDRLQEEFDRIQEVLKLRRCTDELAALEDLFQKVDHAARTLAELQQRLNKLPGLTEEKLRTIQKLDREIGKLTAQIEAIGLTIELTPIKNQKVEIKEGTEKRSLNLKAGQAELIKTGHPIELHLLSWGRIRVQSGAQELIELRRQRDKKQHMLRSELAKLGVTTVQEAAAVLEKRKLLENDIQHAQRELKAALGEHPSLESLKNQLAQQRVLVENLRKSLSPSETESQASLTELELELERLRVEIKAAEKRVQHALENREKLQKDLTERKDKKHSIETELAQLQEQRRQKMDRIAQLEERYPNGLVAARAAAQQEFGEAEARVETLRRQLPPDADKLSEYSRQAVRAAAEAEENLKTARAERDRLIGILQTLGGEGLYSRESELHAQIEAKELEVKAARQRGWAARVLRDLLARRKQTAIRAVLTPLENRISATFAELTGNDARKVFLDEQLMIRGVGPNERELIPFELLSQGAKEQLLLALRIAVARVTAETEPQVLVLDDVLVNTDPVRQQRVLKLLEDSAQKLQIIVLTCHIDRYRGGGRVLKLETRQT